MKLINNKYLNIFLDEESLSDKFFTAEYYIRTNKNKGDLLKASYELAIGQSIGNPHLRSNYESDSLIQNHSCKILHKVSELENK